MDFERPIERAREHDAGAARRLVDVVVAVGRRSLEDDVFGLSAALAYRFFLALFPFAIFLATLGGFIAAAFGTENPARQLVAAIGSTIPPELSSVIEQELSRIIERRDAGILTFGGIAAVFLASGGTTAVIKATNQAYNVEESRPFVRRLLVASGLTVLAGIAIILAFVAVVTGELFGRQIAEAIGQEGPFNDLLFVARWPVAFGLLFAGVLVLYRLAPNMALPWRRVAAGAMAFSVGWLVATWGFALYVSTLASYGATFGALAGVAVLLIWFDLTAMILLTGAELNAVLDEVARPAELERDREAARRDRREREDRPG